MPDNYLRTILIGDVIGRYGRNFAAHAIPLIRRKYSPHLIIANGENSAGGLGIIKKTADELFDAGVNVITGGNHIWDKKEALDLLKVEMRILRPINYNSHVPGRGFFHFPLDDGDSILVINLQGRVFMDPVVDNPFTTIDRFLQEDRPKTVIIDFHAEATAEKMAMGFFLDGRVSAVLGTHTHVPTADTRILPKGTAFQSDVGMTGSADSVIGMSLDNIIPRFVTGISKKMEVAKGNLVLDMTMVESDRTTGRAVRIEALRLWESTYEEQLS